MKTEVVLEKNLGQVNQARSLVLNEICLDCHMFPLLLSLFYPRLPDKLSDNQMYLWNEIIPCKSSLNIHFYPSVNPGPFSVPRVIVRISNQKASSTCRSGSDGWQACGPLTARLWSCCLAFFLVLWVGKLDFGGIHRPESTDNPSHMSNIVSLYSKLINNFTLIFRPNWGIYNV